jgi:hypothetical protein
MIGQLWHVYPTGVRSALDARHTADSTPVHGAEPQPECWLCVRGFCEQRTDEGYPAVIMHRLQASRCGN